ncbi:cysteine peptidase family C39 domain-containing protein, partial [Providencia sp. PROV193]|uniref:cysteine peptidase family C39 domain-containing protein n=1 Tax=Providencia sp. PROV193 TaxID=2949894 RepID=UPI002349BAE4
TMMALAQAKDTKDYAIALLTSLPLERAVAVMGRLIKTTGTALQRKPLKGGAGGNWNVMNEIVDPTVVKQVTPTSCGAACGEMILKDRNIFTSHIKLGTELTSMNSLANKLNKVDSGWVANNVSSSSFESLNRTGSWSAMMWDSGNKVGHWVVVKGVDNGGNVIINDPFKGTRYTMKVNEFKDAWNGHSVYKP